MNTDTFIESFGHIADAPGGVDKLRALILDLAVRGRLVDQDPGDEPASVLLDRIRAERERMVQAREIRKPKPLLPIDPDDVPYELPEGWAWSRLPDVGEWANGAGFPKGDQGLQDGPILFCKVSDMNRPGNERWLRSCANSITEETARKLGATAHVAGTVVFPKIGGAIATNKRRQLVQPTAIDNNCMGVTPLADLRSDWLFYLLCSVDMTEYQSGTSLPALSHRALNSLVFGLPPVTEQQRIVEKVDQLMDLCDELEAAQFQREQKRVDLGVSTLRHLAEAGEGDLGRFWSKFSDNVDLHLAPGPGDLATLKELRRTILDLAVRGRLTSRDPQDEPASVLIDRIRAERERMVATKEIRKSKPLPPIAPDEIPYELPDGWEWARLGELGTTVTGTTPKDRNVSGGTSIPFVKPADVFADDAHVGETITVDGSSLGRSIPAGSALMVCIGGSIGKAGYTTRGILTNQQINAFTPTGIETGRFVSLVFLSSVAQSWVMETASGGTTMPIINKGTWSQMLIPVPPINEQHRIVNTVSRLMEYCDELEQMFMTAEIRRGDLATSVVAHAVDAPELVPA